MIEHTLHIGECVWDDVTERWGYIALIANKNEDCIINEETRDAIVLLTDSLNIDGRYSEWETEAEDCYQIAPGRFFWGEIVCFEHFKDEMDSEHDFDYYCPSRSENWWEFEVCQ